MKLIFIHGRAQEGKDEIKLRDTWIEAFKKGLDASDLELPIPEENILFPYYGDKLEELVNEIDEPIEEIIQRGAKTNDSKAGFFKDFLDEIANNAQITTEQITENYEGDVKERGLLNWGWVQAILRTLDNSFLGTWSIKKFTYDVFIYLTHPNVKKVVNGIVSSQITKGERVVVVGHSLGSIVGYNVLYDSNAEVVKYITVGSPLGLSSVRKYLPLPLRMPSCVSNGWFNAYDEGDVVALNPLDANTFNITPPIVNKKDVENHTDNQHGIVGYLDDPVVAKTIYESLMVRNSEESEVS